MHFYCYSADWIKDLLYFKRLMWTDYVAVDQSLTVFSKCTCKPCDQEIINTRNEAAHTRLYFQKTKKQKQKNFFYIQDWQKKKIKKNELAINKDRPNPHHRRLLTKAPPPPPPFFRGNKIQEQQYIKNFFFKGPMKLWTLKGGGDGWAVKMRVGLGAVGGAGTFRRPCQLWAKVSGTVFWVNTL